MSRAHDLVTRHVAAFNARDVDALLDDFAPSAEWVTGDYAVPGGELREFFTAAMESITPRLRIHRIIDGGGVVAVEMYEEWTYEGVPKTARLVAVFDLAAGKIARAKIYREGSANA